MPAGGSRLPASHETVDQRLHFVHQDGQTVYKFAVRKMAELSEAVLERNGVSGSELGCLIPHQANQRTTDAVADRLGVDPSRVYSNIAMHGNTSSASIPIAMDECATQGRLQPGDPVLLASFGGGATWGAVALRW